jgi:hypothetical protein
MSELDVIQSTGLLDDDSAAEMLLDSSSLNTVLAMLEVIDSLEELALLETLTPAQKRQVWEATCEQTRQRLRRLRTASPVEAESPQPASPTADLPEVEDIEELEAIHPEAQLQLTRQLIQNAVSPSPNHWQTGSTSAVTGPVLAAGDWIVLQAKPPLSRAELMAIWEVLAVEGQNARIFAQQLGQRTYPIHWMVIYPKPADYVEPEF